MAHYGGGVPAGHAPDDARTVVIPESADPDSHPDVRRKLDAGWTRGEVLPQSNRSGQAVVYLYPPKP